MVQRLKNAPPKSCLPNQSICLGCCKALRHTLAMDFCFYLGNILGHLPDKISVRTGSKLLWLYSEQDVSNMQLILLKDPSMGTTEEAQKWGGVAAEVGILSLGCFSFTFFFFILPLPISFLSFFFFFWSLFIYFQRESTSWVGTGREGERILSKLRTVSTEPNTGLKLTNCEIMT